MRKLSFLFSIFFIITIASFAKEDDTEKLKQSAEYKRLIELLTHYV